MTGARKWSENVILADADYIDNVAFNFIVNFERMLGRRIPKADMAQWIDCVALDGGMRSGSNETQVVLIHGKHNDAMENFTPADYARELDGKAFSNLSNPNPASLWVRVWSDYRRSEHL